MPAMRIRGCLLIAVLAGCGDDDPLAACDQPVHLSDVGASVARSGDDTFITVDDILLGSWTQVGPACGAAPTLSIEGMALTPARVHLDPADDDPTIACHGEDQQLYRIDPTGDEPPRLLLPHLRCDPIPTRHGPLFDTRLQDGALWLVPDFPDDATAAPIGADVVQVQLVDDLLVHRDSDGRLARTDLATGETTPLRGGVADFHATATHVLVRSDVDPDTAPMHVLDIATGELAYIGLYHADEDRGYSARSTEERSWALDPTGRYVMHTPEYPTPLAAFDLAGRPAAFPDGESVRVHPGGVYVVCSADAVVAARPGDPDVIPLDMPTCQYSSFVGDHLEAIVDGDLYHVPLDGSPRSLLAREIGSVREWLDEHHILTIYGGELLTVVAATNYRRRHTSSAWNFRAYPGTGVFFWVAHYPATPGDGLWFLPESRIFPTLAPCTTGFYCR